MHPFLSHAGRKCLLNEENGHLAFALLRRVIGKKQGKRRLYISRNTALDFRPCPTLSESRENNLCSQGREEHVHSVCHLPRGHMTLHFRSFQVDFIAFLTFLLKVSREGKCFSFCDKWRTGIREKEKENIFFCYFRMCAYFHLLKYFSDFYILMRQSPWYFGTIFQWMTGFPFLVWVFVTAHSHSKAPTLWAVWPLWFKCYMSFTGPCVYTCSPAGGTVWKGCRTFGREPVWRMWAPVWAL